MDKTLIHFGDTVRCNIALSLKNMQREETCDLFPLSLSLSLSLYPSLSHTHTHMPALTWQAWAHTHALAIAHILWERERMLDTRGCNFEGDRSCSSRKVGQSRLKKMHFDFKVKSQKFPILNKLKNVWIDATRALQLIGPSSRHRGVHWTHPSPLQSLVLVLVG